MRRNVMSPILARRLAACINNAPRNHHIRLFTGTPRWQQTPSDDNRDHIEKLALLQAEDLRLLLPVKDKVSKYQTTVDETRKFLLDLPNALEPILAGNKDSVYTLGEHRTSISDALASTDRLKDVKLPNLLAHLGDLEVEEFPEPGSQEEEIDFLQRVRSSSPAERNDILMSLESEITALKVRSADSVRRNSAPLDESDSATPSPTERKENPFAKTAAKAPVVGDAGKKKAENKSKFGLSTDEQFANVVANAAAAAEAAKPKNKVEDNSNFGLAQENKDPTSWKPTPAVENKSTSPPAQAATTSNNEPKSTTPKAKPPTHDLNSLQAKLEASWKKSR